MRLLAACALSLGLLAACGGGEPADGSNATRPTPLAAASQDTTSVVLRLHQAYYGTAPSSGDLSIYSSQLTSSGAAAVSSRFANDYAALSDSALAARVLDNLRINAVSVNSVAYTALSSALAQIFAAYGSGARAQVVLNLVNLLVDLESNATFGAAAVAYNAQVSANRTYSTSSSAFATQVVRTATYQAAYSECYVGTPALYTATYCAAYAAARDVGASATVANQMGAIAAGSNVGNIGTGGTITSTGTPLSGTGSTGSTSGTSSGGTTSGTSSGSTSSGSTSGGTTSGGTTGGSTTGSTSGSTSGTSSGSVNWQSSFSANEIIEDSSTLSANARKGWTFDVTGSSLPVEVVFAAQYSADLYVTTAAGMSACVNGGSFSYYSSYSFQGQFGFNQFTLPVGSYGVCLVNRVNQSNGTRLEFQYQPTVTGFHYSQQRFSTVTRTVSAGGRVTQPVTVGSTYRVIIEGGNTGGTYYIIPASEQSSFLSGGSFRYYTSIDCSSGRAAPGLCEIPGAGDYALAYYNDTSAPQSIVIIGRDYVPD